MRKRTNHICVDCLCTYTGFGRQLRCPDCQRKHRVQATQACMARKQDGTGRMVGRTYYCVQCNKPFVLKGGNQRFCPECAEKRKRPERTYTGALFDAPATQPTQDKSTAESDAIVARFLAGESQRHIAKAMGVSHCTVTKVLLTADCIATAESTLFKQGYKPAEIANMLGKSYNAVMARLPYLRGKYKENQTANALYIQRWRQGSGYYVPDKEE